ncbi:probable G-protein coupled receptor Mth-like 3 isoform X2 [Octopus sinensis]|uniref:Probable G-protein coupled receptor Mth-like 3 isoform X2 n=1 Tax=Octopus sinensis TaxID=2607531 RepID=A0A7E6F4U3_9MOLL|nr:probable G-protein coupled receptor Mth-like 3 isoform X2 [Octopus sinensis]
MEVYATSYLIFILLINHAVPISAINKIEAFNCPPVLCSESPWTDRCSCQQDCYLYDECCSDRLNHTASDLETPYPSMYYSCNNINGGTYYQFHRCPTNYDVTEHVNNCENPNSDQQLHDKTSKKLYRNLYCALCHREEYILWKISYQCFYKDDIPNITVDNILCIFNNKSCEIYNQVPSNEFNQYLYRCTPYVSVCALHNTNKTLDNLCENKPMRLVNANNTMFRNIYCALCNGIEADDIKCGTNTRNIRTHILGKYSEAEDYITFVGLVISIPALAITIIVYLCIPDLRTLPGKLLISLLSAMLIAELLLFISLQVTTSTVLCTALAILKHYSFVATFFWTNVVSCNAWYTFSGFIQHRSSGKGTKRLVLYSLYAWICPLVIVTVSLILEYTPGNHGLSPEYGKCTCWISNRKSVRWLFSVPVIIILCLNIIAFILIARGLYMANKLSAKYLSKHNKLEFIACIKLFFIMGFTWTFQFLHVITEIEEFSLIFYILNSFLGVFISLSFLITKTVCHHITKRHRPISKYLQTKSNAISSTSHRILSTHTNTNTTYV